jgi:hypothetical protein
MGIEGVKGHDTSVQVDFYEISVEYLSPLDIYSR